MASPYSNLMLSLEILVKDTQMVSIALKSCNYLFNNMYFLFIMCMALAKSWIYYNEYVYIKLTIWSLHLLTIDLKRPTKTHITLQIRMNIINKKQEALGEAKEDEEGFL